MTRIRTGLAVLLALPALLGCHQKVARVELPGVNVPAETEYRDRGDGLRSRRPAAAGDPVDVELEGFLQAVAPDDPEVTLGCLPLASYDADHEGPWVSALGVHLAEQLVAGAGPWSAGSVLAPVEMEARLDEARVPEPTLSSLSEVRRHRDALQVDLVALGTIRRERDVGERGRDVLQIELLAYDVDQDRLVAHRQFEVPSDREDVRWAWQMAAQPALWRGSR